MLIGHIDRADANVVAGWAWDDADPARRVVLEFCDGADVITEIRADLFRQDLAVAGIGDGRYAFSLSLPPRLLSGPVHLLHVRFKETGAALRRSPQRVYPTQAGLDPEFQSWLARQVDNCVSAAVEPRDLMPFITLFANGLSRLLSAEARLLDLTGSAPVATLDREALPARLKQALERSLRQCPPLHVPVYRQPRLSIIIAGSAQFAVNHGCIASIVASPGLRDYEIIFVDVTGTSDMALAPFMIGGGIRFVATAQAAPVLEAYRMGKGLARGSRLLFLGHLASVAPDAIAALSETLDAYEGRAIVAPRLVGRDGRIVEAGARFDAMAVRRPVGPLELRETTRLRVLRPSHDAPTRAFMLDAVLLDSVGGFDGIDAMGSFGMADVAFRLREAGARVLVQGFADVIVTGSSDRDAGDDRGRRAFLARWHAQLPQVSAEAERMPRKLALVVDERLPDASRDAASVALLSHAEALVALGYHVEFACVLPDCTAHDGGRGLFMRGIEAHPPETEARSILASRAGQFELVYLHRLSVAQALLKHCRETQPQARLLYSVADLHGLRLRREAEATDAVLLAQAEQAEAAERGCIAQADVVITHSRHEAAWIAEVAPERRVARLLWSVPLNPSPAPFVERSGFCFIGTGLHKPNIDAVKHFLADQWSALRAACGDASFEIAGSHFELGGFDTRQPGVVGRGFVAQLRPYLAGIRVMLAPLRYGAGVKGKVLLSLAEGLPCVMSAIAAEGIDLPDEMRALMVGRDKDEFVALAAELHRDEARWNRASALASAWASDHLSADSIARQMGAVLGS